MESFEVRVEGFSGPLDLLCHLVESRQFEASKIRVSQLVRIYGAYLAQTRKASADTLADFFYMAAGLLLEKARSLLPGYDEPEEEDMDPELDEAALLAALARYRPYRAAARWLWEKREKEARSFRRPSLAETSSAPRETVYDIGDLYFLSRVWWGLFERFCRDRRQEKEELLDELGDSVWDGMPEALPDEAQIENRILELGGLLSEEGSLSLNALCRSARSVKLLVVTLLALLEMCRMGKIAIEQERLFDDVKVLPKPVPA